MADNDSGDDILAFLFGGLIGAAIALLLAPQTGAETRECVADWLDEGRKRTKEYLDEKSANDA